LNEKYELINQFQLSTNFSRLYRQNCNSSWENRKQIINNDRF